MNIESFTDPGLGALADEIAGGQSLPAGPQSLNPTSGSTSKSNPPTSEPLLDTYGNDFELPNYSIKDLRDAVPKHCFERSAVRSFGLLARDLVQAGVWWYVFQRYVTATTVPSWTLRFALWIFYTFVQGLTFSGLWVIAHECGHQGFSTSKTVNDTTGFVVHSALLTPYFSWKLSHKSHHANHGNLDRDNSFVPKSRETFATRGGYLAHQLDEITEEVPLRTGFELVLQQLIGFWVYLAWNEAGGNNHVNVAGDRGKGKFNRFRGGVSHFSPSSPLYKPEHRNAILLSDLGLFVAGTALYCLVSKFGLSNVAVGYFVPYLWMNHWIVAIVYLHHTDPSLPHYDASSWTYVRGAAATVDRSLGWVVGCHFFHHITDTHVLHHTFSTIPFYHAHEATEAIKPVMGTHYHAEKGGMWTYLGHLWKISRWCQWIEDSDGQHQDQDQFSQDGDGLAKHVYFFRNRNGLGIKPKVMKVV